MSEEEIEVRKEWYREEHGLVFLEDEWSLWHIRVWANSRIGNGFAIYIDPATVFEYARKYDMDTVDTLEYAKTIERGVQANAKES